MGPSRPLSRPTQNPPRTPQGKLLVHHRPLLRRSQSLRNAAMVGQRPIWQCRAGSDITKPEAGLQTPDNAYGILRIRITIRPIDRVAIRNPAQNRRVCRAANLLAIDRPIALPKAITQALAPATRASAWSLALSQAAKAKCNQKQSLKFDHPVNWRLYLKILPAQGEGIVSNR